MQSPVTKLAYITLVNKNICLNCQGKNITSIDIGDDEIFTCGNCNTSYRVNHPSKTVTKEG